MALFVRAVVFLLAFVSVLCVLRALLRFVQPRGEGMVFRVHSVLLGRLDRAVRGASRVLRIGIGILLVLVAAKLASRYHWLDMGGVLRPKEAARDASK